GPQVLPPAGAAVPPWLPAKSARVSNLPACCALGPPACAAPAPYQKQPPISPIFISDKVTLHVSREKDGKLHLVDAGWDDTKVVPPDGCGQARRGGGRAKPTLHRVSSDAQPNTMT